MARQDKRIVIWQKKKIMQSRSCSSTSTYTQLESLSIMLCVQVVCTGARNNQLHLDLIYRTMSTQTCFNWSEILGHKKALLALQHVHLCTSRTYIEKDGRIAGGKSTGKNIGDLVARSPSCSSCSCYHINSFPSYFYGKCLPSLMAFCSTRLFNCQQKKQRLQQLAFAARPLTFGATEERLKCFFKEPIHQTCTMHVEWTSTL